MRFLEHCKMISGNYPDIEASSGQIFPALIGLVRGEERLHAGTKESETTGIDRGFVLSERGAVRARLCGAFGELKEVTQSLNPLEPRS